MNNCETNTANACATDGAKATNNNSYFQPAVDIVELANEYQLVADIPGATAESVNLQLEKGVLSIHAAVATRHVGKGPALVREYGVGDYRRSLRVGDGVDASKIAAAYTDGVLTVRLPKTAVQQAQRIPIAANV